MDEKKARNIVKKYINFLRKNKLNIEDEQMRNSWVREKNMKAFSFYSDKQPLGEIDLIIDSPIPI